jgi:transcriptional regulator with XRE-family HTH domain
MTFGERLRELRQAAGLSQPQLADAAGVPVGSIRNYEQGQREPYWFVVFKLAKALGVSCEAFAACVPVEGVKPPPPAPRRGKGRKGRGAQG